jgi:hypothetical protein
MPRGRPRKNPEQVLIKGAELIGWALGGLEREIMETKQRLSALTAQATQLRSKLPGSAQTRGPAAAASFDEPAVTQGRKRRRRRMSPEARKRISEMMKKRWAERRKK